MSRLFSAPLSQLLRLLIALGLWVVPGVAPLASLARILIRTVILENDISASFLGRGGGVHVIVLSVEQFLI